VSPARRYQDFEEETEVPREYLVLGEGDTDDASGDEQSEDDHLKGDEAESQTTRMPVVQISTAQRDQVGAKDASLKDDSKAVEVTLADDVVEATNIEHTFKGLHAQVASETKAIDAIKIIDEKPRQSCSQVIGIVNIKVTSTINNGDICASVFSTIQEA
jgi:hypothetical protein